MMQTTWIFPIRLFAKNAIPHHAIPHQDLEEQRTLRGVRSPSPAEKVMSPKITCEEVIFRVKYA